ncbi:MAG: nuclear transport factor 2 family protein [Polyangiales bacterium]
MDAPLTTEALLDAHLRRFAAGDLEGILSEYADDAVLISADGVLRGPAAIRPLFVAMFDEFSQPGVTFALQARRVEGDCAYIAWRAETPQRSYTLGADTFVVRDGRIVYQTSAIASTPKR